MTDRREARERNKKPARRPWRLLAVLLVLGSLAWFAPAIVARTSLRQQILPFLADGFAGQIDTGSVRLGWFSPVVFGNVKATDAQGQPLLEVATITSKKTLLAILTNQSQPGELVLRQPHLHLTLRADGSNLEDAIAPILKKEGEPSTMHTLVRVVDGTVDVQQAESQQNWQATKLNVALDYPNREGQPLSVKLEGLVQEGEHSAGKLAAEVQWHIPRGEKAAGIGGGEIDLRCEQMPLAIVPAVLRRFGLDVDVAGRLTTHCRYVCKTEDGQQTLSILNMAAKDFQLVAPQWLGNDRLQLADMQARGSVSSGKQGIEVDNLSLQCDVARLLVEGRAGWDQLQSTSLGQQDFRINGQIDLAALAKTLPTTLHIRQGTRITSGKVSLSAFSRLEGDNRRWLADVETSNLAATDGGREIRWEQPIRLTVRAHDSPQGPVFDELACESSFLQLDGSAAPGKVNLTAQGDLNQLAKELGRFVDFGSSRLAGKLKADLSWQRQDNDQFAATADLDLQNLEVVFPLLRPWQEEKLTVSLSADGLANRQGLKRLEKCQLVVESAGDRLSATLLQPVDSFTAKSVWPLEVQLQGELASWLPRVQSVLPLAGWKIEGEVKVDSTISASAERIDVQQASLQASQLRLHGGSLAIDEQEILAKLTGAWERTAGRFSVREMTWQSSAMAFRADNVSLAWQDETPIASGEIVYRADLTRLTNWFRNASAVPKQQLYGQLTGQLQLAYRDGVTNAKWTADVDQFIYALPTKRAGNTSLTVKPAANANPWQAVWMEKQLHLSGDGDYHHGDAQLQLANFVAKSDWLNVRAKGKISGPASQCTVDVTGRMQYDGKNVVAKLRPYLGSDFQLEGQRDDEFSLRGPLFASAEGSTSSEKSVGLVSTQLVAAASLGWSKAQYQGFTFGQATLKANLAEGILKIEPLDLPVNEGRLKTAPQVALNKTPATLVVGKGPLIERVHISPEMCQSWLKYVAPLVADATRADGRFSVDLEGANVPLPAPATTQTKGTLQIHAAQIGPGPLGQQIVLIARQIKALVDGRPLGAATAATTSGWVLLPEQKVGFDMRDGRVHHDRLEMTVSDVSIITRGSVGTDQTLSMVASVPIRDSWVQRNRLLAGLKGKTLEIPIHGTLSKPKVDQKALEGLGRQLLGGAANKLLEDELLRGLDRLFAPKK